VSDGTAGAEAVSLYEAHVKVYPREVSGRFARLRTAAVVVLSESDTHRDRAVDAARKLMAFFATESCGQCTPCRSGTARMLDLIRTEHWDRALLADLSLVMREASICGLGRAAPNPVDCVLRHFPHELT